MRLNSGLLTEQTPREKKKSTLNQTSNPDKNTHNLGKLNHEISKIKMVNLKRNTLFSLAITFDIHNYSLPLRLSNILYFRKPDNSIPFSKFDIEAT